MRVPKYQNQSPVSLGGTYRQAITQQSPGGLRPGQRDTRAYLVDASAGQVSSQLVAQAHASKVNITDAIVDAGNDIYEAFREADGASEYAKAKSEFDVYNRTQVHAAKSEPFLMPNPDKKGKYEFVPAFPHMSENYLKDANANIKAYANTISHEGYRAKFISAATADLNTTYNQIENYRHTKHIEYLQGEVQSRLFEATTFVQVDEIIEGVDARMSMTGEQLFNAKKTAYKKLSTDYWAAELATHKDNSMELDQIITRVQMEGDEQDAPYLEWLDQSAQDKIVNQALKLQDRIDAEIDEATERSVAEELINIIQNPDYKEQSIYDFFEDNPSMESKHLNAMLTAFKSSKAGALEPNPEMYSVIAENLNDYDLVDIASRTDLMREERTDLITRKLAQMKGQLMWETEPQGKRALQWLREFHQLPTSEQAMTSFLSNASGDKAEQHKKYIADKLELQAMLFGLDAGQTEVADSDKAAEAFKWVRKKIEERRLNDANAKKSEQNLDDWFSNYENAGPGGIPWTKAGINALPNDQRAKQLDKMNEAGVDTSWVTPIEEPDPDEDAETGYWKRLLKLLGRDDD